MTSWGKLTSQRYMKKSIHFVRQALLERGEARSRQTRLYWWLEARSKITCYFCHLKAILWEVCSDRCCVYTSCATRNAPLYLRKRISPLFFSKLFTIAPPHTHTHTHTHKNTHKNTHKKNALVLTCLVLLRFLNFLGSWSPFYWKRLLFRHGLIITQMVPFGT